MARRKKTIKDYANFVKKLRKEFRGFEARDGFDLRKYRVFTPVQKSKITRKERMVRVLQTRNNVVLRMPRKEAHQRSLQRDAQYEHFDKDAKKVYFPAPETANVKIRYSRSKKKAKKNKPIITVNRVRVIPVHLDKKAYLADPEAELRRVIDVVPDAQMYQFMAGEHSSLRTYVKEGLVQILKLLREKYDNTDEWLLGIRAYVGPPAKVERLRSRQSRARIERKQKKKKRGKVGQRRAGRVR